MISRRTFLAGSIATAAGASGVAWLYTDRTSAWIERTVRANLPGIALDEAALRRFVQDVRASQLFAPRLSRMTVFAHATLPWVTARVPRARRGLEKLERRVLTEFLLGSNFFQVADPRRTTIIYHGLARVCPNPFADFAQPGVDTHAARERSASE